MRPLLLVSTLLLFFVFLTPSVFAVDKPAGVGGKSAVASTRLSGGELRACQAKEIRIKKRITILNHIATNMESKFDSIAVGVEDYYTSKVVHSGKKVSNYGTLASDIQTKKMAVQIALNTAKISLNNFTCTSDDPRGQLTQFGQDTQVIKSALKEYRASIKNLIVAVHSVTGSK